MTKELNFPPDVEEFIHELVARAILRSMGNEQIEPDEEQIILEKPE